MFATPASWQRTPQTMDLEMEFDMVFDPPNYTASTDEVPNNSRNFGRNQNRKGDKKPPPIPTSSNGQGIPAQPSAGWAPNTSATGKQTMRPLMLCQPFVKASLLKGSFKTIVVLPKYVDEGEWIALNGQSSLTLL